MNRLSGIGILSVQVPDVTYGNDPMGRFQVQRVHFLTTIPKTPSGGDYNYNEIRVRNYPGGQVNLNNLDADFDPTNPANKSESVGLPDPATPTDFIKPCHQDAAHGVYNMLIARVVWTAIGVPNKVEWGIYLSQPT